MSLIWLLFLLHFWSNAFLQSLKISYMYYQTPPRRLSGRQIFEYFHQKYLGWSTYYASYKHGTWMEIYIFPYIYLFFGSLIFKNASRKLSFKVFREKSLLNSPNHSILKNRVTQGTLHLHIVVMKIKN